MSRRSYLPVLAALALAAVGLAAVTGAFAASGPAVSATTASAVTNNGATVSATVNPNGQATTYAFEYGTSAQYTQQTAPQNAGTATTPAAASAQLSGLQPGTTYHVRVIATNASGTVTGSDSTFVTSGVAPPAGSAVQATTGAASSLTTEGGTLSGTIAAPGVTAGEPVRYYFQLGTALPYTIDTIPQTVAASATAQPVTAQVSGLANLQLYHYRLVAEPIGGQQSVGADQTLTTLALNRPHPSAVQFSASPVFQRRMPDRVTVSGKMVPPAGMSELIGCRGYFDITFRVDQIAVQSLRAGIQSNCTFSLPVVFHSAARLLGGHITVHVLYAGSQFLERLEAPTKTIQVGP